MAIRTNAADRLNAAIAAAIPSRRRYGALAMGELVSNDEAVALMKDYWTVFAAPTTSDDCNAGGESHLIATPRRIAGLQLGVQGGFHDQDPDSRSL
jgi:hypothetical protein